MSDIDSPIFGNNVSVMSASVNSLNRSAICKEDVSELSRKIETALESFLL